MNASDQLTALADPTRRAIFEHLVRQGPMAVAQVAEAFPVSRPAVSQHLKVLVAAGLVAVNPAGNQRIYVADPSGISALQRWVDAHWQSVLDHFGRAARQEEAAMADLNFVIPPVQKTCTVPLSSEAAFDLFTVRIGEWWPVDSFSVTGDTPGVTAVRFEGRVGGRVVELTKDGNECSWGDVLAWSPPTRFVLSWHPSREPEAASRLEVTFTPVEGGTEVSLRHSGWEEFGDDGMALRGSYDGGWDTVLGFYRDASRKAG